MSHAIDDLLARVSVERGLIGAAELAAARRLQAGPEPAPPLAVVLVEQGYLTHAQVARLLGDQAEACGPADPAAPGAAGAWRFACIALERGLATNDQVNRALRTQAAGLAAGHLSVALDRILLEQGAMSEDGIAEVLFLQAEHAPTQACMLPPAPPSSLTHPPVAAGAAPPATALRPSAAPGDPKATIAAAEGTAAVPDTPRRSLGPYQLLHVLGHGGMGMVYKAYRPDLDAAYAVKIMLLGDQTAPDAAQRFQREAQIAARLRHPGIVTVHDFGSADGKTYLVMEYVDGVGLDRALHDPARAGLAPAETRGPAGRRRRGLGLRDAARIAREVADAIDYAHSQGVIHRDLKPANVLLGRDGRARVVDFGLAKLKENAGASRAVGLTRSGSFFGTPAYMPPEQAAGEVSRIDARSDVYSLGVMLYELVTGQVPFEGDNNVELVMKVLTRDPARPASLNRDLPRDLETIVRKAMEKDQARRYPSAGEMAADLQRFLDGEPIRARGASVHYRALIWARRRRGLVATLAVLALAAGAGGLAAWHAHAAGLDRTRLRARVLDELKTKATWYVDAALTLRRSGVPMRKAQDEYLPLLEQAVRAAAEVHPDLAEPHYQLGFMYRALLRFDDALRAQEAALARDPRYTPSRYERAVLTARAYAARLRVLREAAWAEVGARLARTAALAAGGQAPRGVGIASDDELAARDDEASRLHAQVQSDLDAIGAAPPSGLTAARAECARGLACACSARDAVGLERARRLLEAAAGREPTLVEAYEGWAQVEEQCGRTEAAIAVYGRGLEQDAGYVPFWLGRGDARRQRAAERLRRGEPPGELYAEAVLDLGRAVELDPAAYEAWRRRGRARRDWAAYTWVGGGDPVPRYTEALADYERALALAARTPAVWLDRGDLQKNWGDFLVDRKGDPRAHWEAAAADFEQAVKLAPRSAVAWTRCGGTWTDLGFARLARGEDPTEMNRRALAAYAEALQLSPAWDQIWMSRGVVGLNWGNFQLGRGEDPTPTSAEAERDLGHALELDPANQAAWLYLGYVHTNMGAWRQNRGEDPGGVYARAVDDYGRAARLLPPSSEAWRQSARVHGNWGQYRQGRGEDPSAQYERAVADWAENLRVGAATEEAFVGRGGVRANWALYRKGRGEDPGSLMAEARQDLGRALELAPGSADARRVRGLLAHALGDWPAAAEDLEAALALAPALAAQVRGPLADAHYHAACGLAREGAHVPAEEGARMRAAAFDHLGRAVTHGWRDRRRLEQDAELEPLRADPRWVGLLERMR